MGYVYMSSPLSFHTHTHTHTYTHTHTHRHTKERETDAAAPTRTTHNLTLEGGAAFGTGDHPTTVLVLRWLQTAMAVVEESSSSSSSSVGSIQSILDYGCGSAILALAALKFGSTSAVGVDIDRDSLVSGRCHMSCHRIT
jgi:ribosomal protein L11 methyltransferase